MMLSTVPADLAGGQQLPLSVPNPRPLPQLSPGLCRERPGTDGGGDRGGRAAPFDAPEEVRRRRATALELGSAEVSLSSACGDNAQPGGRRDGGVPDATREGSPRGPCAGGGSEQVTSPSSASRDESPPAAPLAPAGRAEPLPPGLGPLERVLAAHQGEMRRVVADALGALCQRLDGTDGRLDRLCVQHEEYRRGMAALGARLDALQRSLAGRGAGARSSGETGEVVAPLPGADPPDSEEEMEVWSSETRVADSPSSWRPCPHDDQTRQSDAAASGAEQSAGAVPSCSGPPSLAGDAGQSCTLERRCRAQRNQPETRQESAEPPAPSGTAAGSLVSDLEELETEGAPGSSVEGRLAGMAHVGLADVDVWPCEEERTHCSSPCTEIPRTEPSADEPQRPVSPEGQGCCCPLSSGGADVSPHAGGSCAHCSRRLPVLVGDGSTGPRAAGGDCAWQTEGLLGGAEGDSDGRTEGRLGGAEGDSDGQTEERLGGAEGDSNGRTEGRLGGAEGGSKGRTEGRLGGAEGDSKGRTEGRLGGAEGDSEGRTEGRLGGAEGDSDGQTEGRLGGTEGDSNGQAEERLGGAEGDSDAGTSPSISGPPSQGSSLERVPAGGEVDLPAVDRRSSGEPKSATGDCASLEGGGASPCALDTQEGVSAVAGLLQAGLIEERRAEQQNLEAHKDRDAEAAMCRSPSIELRASSCLETDTSISLELRASSCLETDTSISPELRAGSSPETDTSISPELRAGSCLETDTSISPELRAGSCLEKDCSISPELRAGSSPGTETSISLELRASSCLETDCSISPELRASSSPETETSISLELRAGSSPGTETSISVELSAESSPGSRESEGGPASQQSPTSFTTVTEGGSLDVSTRNPTRHPDAPCVSGSLLPGSELRPGRRDGAPVSSPGHPEAHTTRPVPAPRQGTCKRKRLGRRRQQPLRTCKSRTESPSPTAALLAVRPSGAALFVGTALASSRTREPMGPAQSVPVGHRGDTRLVSLANGSCRPPRIRPSPPDSIALRRHGGGQALLLKLADLAGSLASLREPRALSRPPGVPWCHWPGKAPSPGASAAPACLKPLWRGAVFCRVVPRLKGRPRNLRFQAPVAEQVLPELPAFLPGQWRPLVMISSPLLPLSFRIDLGVPARPGSLPPCISSDPPPAGGGALLLRGTDWACSILLPGTAGGSGLGDAALAQLQDVLLAGSDRRAALAQPGALRSFSRGRVPRRASPRPRSGLHTVLALSSPTCYRLWTRQRGAGGPLGEGFRVLLTQTQPLPQSDSLLPSLHCFLGRILGSWGSRPPHSCLTDLAPLCGTETDCSSSRQLDCTVSVLPRPLSRPALPTSSLLSDPPPDPHLGLPGSEPPCPEGSDSEEEDGYSPAEADSGRQAAPREDGLFEKKLVEQPGQRSKRVSQIRIRKAVPKPDNNLTPMGLPKPKRLKKKEFSLEEIYTNKNYCSPPSNSLETIFEEPREKNGALVCIGQQKRKRMLDFPDFTLPRKRRARGGVRVRGGRGRGRRARQGDADLDLQLIERLSDLDHFLTQEGLEV